MKIRKGDQVMIVSGRDKGKQGRVERVIPADRRVVVAGLNTVTRHVRPRAGVRQAGRVQQEAPLDASNVRLMCSACNRPVRTRSHNLENGMKVRICQRCQETIDWSRGSA